MRKSLAIYLLLLISFCAKAVSPIIEEADKAYMSDNFNKALELYLKAEKEEGTSSDIYYNIGNTYYRLGMLGKAVLYYERALKLDPSNSDARSNLEFVRTQLVDAHEKSSSWTDSINEKAVRSMSPNSWAVTAVILFAIFLFLVAVYIISGNTLYRKLSFFGGLCVIVLTVVTVYYAFLAASEVNDDKSAVVITPTVQLSTVPRLPQNANEHAFTLHEGALVEIVDTIKVVTDSINPVWYDVKFNNDNRAWIPASDVERI